MSTLDRAGSQTLKLPPHVRILSPVVDHDFVVEWYDACSEEHFWFAWRLLALLRQLRRLGVELNRRARALDVGCGIGILRQQLEATTMWSVDCTDLNVQSLLQCRPGHGQCLYYDITQMRSELHKVFDYVIAFDVIEHLTETKLFLESCLFHLKDRGLLLLNVPALQFVFSEYDVAAGHYRRYTKGTLKAELNNLEAEVLDVAYWGLQLIPLLIVRKLTLHHGRERGETVAKGFAQPNRVINGLLKVCARLETTILPKPPLGTSALIAVRRALPRSQASSDQ